MKTLTLVALLVFVVSVSGFPWLKDAGREHLKREIIERLKEKIAEKMADKTNDVGNNDLMNNNEAAKELDELDAIMPQIDDEVKTRPEADIQDEITKKEKVVGNNIANDESDDANDESDDANDESDDANDESDDANDESDDANNESDDANNESDDANNESDDANNESDDANDESDDKETVDPVKMVSKSYLNRLMNVVENLDNGVRTQDSDILKAIETQQMIQSKILKLTEAMIRGGFIEVPLNETTPTSV